MAHRNEELARGALAAFQSGDLDALREKYFAPNIRWHQPGKSSLAGDYEGPEQVIQLFIRQFELTAGTFGVDAHDVLANDEHVVELLTVHGERNGKQLSEDVVLTAHVADGKFSEAWIHPTNLYALDEFFA
jgi:ketosteroid isomerase-like protein